MDDSDSGEWIHLKRGVDCRGCGPIGLRGHCIMLCSGVRPPSGELGGARHRGWSQGRPGRTVIDTKTAEVLGVEFWFESLRKDILVPRGTQISYSAAVDLVAELGFAGEIAKVQSKFHVPVLS
ncbi:hypothetical protein M9H77_16275 [Catharanthus roseus]|uniref:Uncharacterized protein n=1 Tax=Catharanthus roseus TaxID=4058 RepID=A0ACC0B1B6_CATRO|nr:hypothetical protein M9H77_16275 [Catharanthus roseus]